MNYERGDPRNTGAVAGYVMRRPVIGLIPAGGVGSRIAPLPMSKELYPLGLTAPDAAGAVRPKVVSEFLLERMRLAGVERAFFILRPGKWDIPAYFGDGSAVSMKLGYLVLGVPYGVPFTLDQAYPFVQDAAVVFGFPDILFTPEDAYCRILSRLDQGRADMVLGLFPTDQPHKAGMVDVDDQWRVKQVIEKPAASTLRHMWAIAAWTPCFSAFLHEHVQDLLRQPDLPAAPEMPIGDVIQVAIERGMAVEAELFEAGSYLDIGTPGDLMLAAHRFSSTSGNAQ